MAKIKNLVAREILDSRGLPTIEADVYLDDGSLGRAAVPSGASTGKREACELRDGDAARYHGKGVLKAIGHLSGEIKKYLIGKDAKNQAELDRGLSDLDGTPNKSRLGANAILAASCASARAQASSRAVPFYVHLRDTFGSPYKEFVLPTPMLNVINGGKHADSGLAVQEFMLVPTGFPSFREALRAASEIYHSLKSHLAKAGFSTSVGDEGGFAPRMKTHEEVLNALQNVIRQSPYEGKVHLALDSAASSFYDGGAYQMEGRKLTAREMTDIYASWLDKYDIISLEDPLAEEDWAGWTELSKRLGAGTTVVGDDIFVTNPILLARGIREKAANAVLIKPNQIGTLTETIETVTLARKNGWACVISHRSGETEDPLIADLAVGVGIGAIKTGAPCRTERLVKYNQLLRIEEALGGKSSFSGAAAFHKVATAVS